MAHQTPNCSQNGLPVAFAAWTGSLSSLCYTSAFNSDLCLEPVVIPM